MQQWAKLAICSAVSAALLSGCGGSSSSGALAGSGSSGQSYAVVGAVSGDFSASSISLVEDLNALEIVNGYAATDESDMVVAAHGDYFYRIGRFQQDNLTKYSLSNPAVAEWQFSVNDGQESANPYQLVFVSNEKAYLLRYGSAKMWIINPSVTADQEDQFKIGEIDLAAYDTVDGKPEMAAAVIVDGKLFVIMQAMDTLGGYVPGDAWVAVIDTTTDTEIDTGKGGSLKGIPLSVRNPLDIDARNGAVYVAGAGRYAGFTGTPAEYTGGIEKIDASSYTSTLVLDDGDDADHPYGQITGLELISDAQLVFRGYTGWGSETLYQLDLATGTVDSAAYNGVVSQDIRALELDTLGRLWIGLADFAAPSIQIVNAVEQTEVATLSLTQNPSSLVFSQTGLQ